MNARRALAAAAVTVLLGGAVIRADAGPRPFHALFVFTVDHGPSAGLVIQGLLTADIDPATGVLAGTLTPGVNPRTGQRYRSVSFSWDGDSLVPNAGVSELQVRGQVQHHAVNLILLDAGGPSQHVFGVGTTENDTGTGLRYAPGAFGGSGAGPEPGDLGGWEAPCCTLR